MPERGQSCRLGLLATDSLVAGRAWPGSRIHDRVWINIGVEYCGNYLHPHS